MRSDVRDLTVVAYGGADVGLLCAAGKVKRVIFAFVSLDFMPLEPAFRQARESGAIAVTEIDEGMMLLGLRAAAWGSPFIPTPVGLGTDVIRNAPDIKVIDSPYDDKEWVAMPALPLDVALVHATRATASVPFSSTRISRAGNWCARFRSWAQRSMAGIANSNSTASRYLKRTC